MKMEQTECLQKPTYKIQTPGNYPEESIQHSESGETLKSRRPPTLLPNAIINIKKNYSTHKQNTPTLKSEHKQII
jgi:hypothetical protein